MKYRVLAGLTILVIGIAAAWGLSNRQSYTNLLGKADFMEQMAVAELSAELAQNICANMKDTLLNAPIILKVSPVRDREYFFASGRQKVLVQEVYNGTELKTGQEIYLSFSAWSVVLTEKYNIVQCGFVNIMKEDKDYLVFLADPYRGLDGETLYPFFGDTVVAPMFCYKDSDNAIIPVEDGKPTYVPYTLVKDNEFFVTSEDALQALLDLKKYMLDKYAYLSDAENETNQVSTFEVDSFEIIAGRPFILQEGMAYSRTEDDNWERYGDWENLTGLYEEEYFVALDSEGTILCEGYPDEEENLPLSAGYARYMKNKLLELNREYAVAALNAGGSGEDWRALLEDGRVMVFMPMQDGESEYKEVPIEGETVAALAGDYALTDSGKVYKGTINSKDVVADTNGDGVMETETEKSFEWKILVSDKSVTDIYASRTSGIGVGINEDGTVDLWKPQDNHWEIDLSQWENISEVSVGFNYVLGLTQDGGVLYAAADKENESKINKLLQDKKNVTHIASAYQTIALLYRDGTVEMMDV
ncbi:MAG: hypothetical protein NC243_13755 [Lachnoclostridium sp.]|nr:hypothetical protein [Lachnoclostridium sp.]MCM1385589.1 hypothetical protein [Lachnoclostridium sp.]